jgi:hypothetical protein
MQILEPHNVQSEKKRETDRISENIRDLVTEEKKEMLYLSNLRLECESEREREKKETEEFIKKQISIREESRKETDAIENFRKTVLWDILRPVDVLKAEAEQCLKSAQKSLAEANKQVIRATEREVEQIEREEELKNRENILLKNEKENFTRVQATKDLEKESLRINNETKILRNDFEKEKEKITKILDNREKEIKENEQANEIRTEQLEKDKNEFEKYKKETKIQLEDQRDVLTAGFNELKNKKNKIHD